MLRTSPNFRFLGRSGIAGFIPGRNTTCLSLLVPPSVRVGCSEQKENQCPKLIFRDPTASANEMIAIDPPSAFLDRMPVTRALPAAITARIG